MSEADDRMRELVAEVASNYFANSHVAPEQIPMVVKQIAASLQGVMANDGGEMAGGGEEAKPTKMTSAQVRKSISPDALVSFEDGKSYKTLRRHLAGRGLTPDQYREKYGLPKDYPMVSPNYSAMRSEMARNLGLGQRGAQARGKGKATGGRGSKAS